MRIARHLSISREAFFDELTSVLARECSRAVGRDITSAELRAGACFSVGKSASAEAWSTMVEACDPGWHLRIIRVSWGRRAMFDYELTPATDGADVVFEQVIDDDAGRGHGIGHALRELVIARKMTDQLFTIQNRVLNARDGIVSPEEAMRRRRELLAKRVAKCS